MRNYRFTQHVVAIALGAFSLAVLSTISSCSHKDDVPKRETATIDVPSVPSAAGLRSPDAFTSFSDDTARSQALFGELAKVLMHPRCLNCHPAGDRPMQGERQEPHHPLVVRGDGGKGAPGLRCATCHGERPYENVPGAPKWHLAPREMAWQGRSPADICQQLKDPARNGGLDATALISHMQDDPLVAAG